MREIKYYEAADGTLFNTIEKCKEYEQMDKQNIIKDFQRLVMRKADGMRITKDGSAFCLAAIDEGWWYVTIIMKNDNDYQTVERYCDLVKGRKKENIKHIYDKEIIIGCGNGNEDNSDCVFDDFYWYGTIEEQIEKYANTLKNFDRYNSF